MGPPSLNGGNFGANSLFALDSGGFNGAAVSQRRKYSGAGLPGVAVVLASMGPPSLNGGNLVSLPLLQAVSLWLQWGRRLSTAEIPPRRLSRP